MTAAVTVLLCVLAAPAQAERLIVIATAPVAGVTVAAGGAVFVEVSGPAVEFPAPSGRQARLPMRRPRLRAPSLPRKRATRSYGYRLLDIGH